MTCSCWFEKCLFEKQLGSRLPVCWHEWRPAQGATTSLPRIPGQSPQEYLSAPDTCVPPPKISGRSLSSNHPDSGCKWTVHVEVKAWALSEAHPCHPTEHLFACWPSRDSDPSPSWIPFGGLLPVALGCALGLCNNLGCLNLAVCGPLFSFCFEVPRACFPYPQQAYPSNAVAIKNKHQQKQWLLSGLLYLTFFCKTNESYGKHLQNEAIKFQIVTSSVEVFLITQETYQQWLTDSSS